MTGKETPFLKALGFQVGPQGETDPPGPLSQPLVHSATHPTPGSWGKRYVQPFLSTGSFCTQQLSARPCGGWVEMKELRKPQPR